MCSGKVENLYKLATSNLMYYKVIKKYLFILVGSHLLIIGDIEISFHTRIFQL